MKDGAIIEARSLGKNFGSLQVIDNVDLGVSEGTVHSIIGPNGAGKTTLFNLLTGFTRVSKGSVFFKGKEITGLPPHVISKRGVGRSFQITSIFPDLPVHENLRIAAQSREKGVFRFLRNFRSLTRAGEKADEVLEAIGLTHKGSMISKNLSYGDKRVLDIGISLATAPEIILLDEPMAGLQEADMQSMTRLIEEVSKTLTVVLIDHNIDQVIAISDVITVLNQGRVIAEGTPDEIQSNESVQEAYLGGY